MKSESREKAASPEDLARLFAERINAGDTEGITELYEPGAVLAVPPGGVTVIGRNAIRAVYERLLRTAPPSGTVEPMDCLRLSDLALVAPRHASAEGRAKVARRQADGSWLAVIDQPLG